MRRHLKKNKTGMWQGGDRGLRLKTREKREMERNQKVAPLPSNAALGDVGVFIFKSASFFRRILTFILWVFFQFQVLPI
jgi:hypothetical protein